MRWGKKSIRQPGAHLDAGEGLQGAFEVGRWDAGGAQDVPVAEAVGLVEEQQNYHLVCAHVQLVPLLAKARLHVCADQETMHIEPRTKLCLQQRNVMHVSPEQNDACAHRNTMYVSPEELISHDDVLIRGQLGIREWCPRHAEYGVELELKGSPKR